MSNAWTIRVWSEYRCGTLTRAYRDVLLTLHTYRGHGGLICPSHETLAGRAKCTARTVHRAMKQARLIGLVDWAERRVKAGWRWLRTSNRYWLTVPDTPPDATLKPTWSRTTGQDFSGGESVRKKEAFAAMVAEARGLPDLLAARRRVMEARFTRNA